MSLLSPRLLLAPVALLALGCAPKPFELTCEASDGTYTLVMPNGNERSGDLGCRAGYQTNTPRKSQRRLVLRLDTGATVAATAAAQAGDSGSPVDSGAAGDTAGGTDTGATVEDWSGTDGVVLGLAWPRGTELLSERLAVQPWVGGIPENTAELALAAGSFAASPELPETAVVSAFITPRYTENGDLRSFSSRYAGGHIFATNYVFAKNDGDTAVLQVVIDELELEDGAVLSMEAEMSLSARAVSLE